jgi:acyl dehydratase
MRVFISFDEVEEAVGTRIGTSDWFEITADQLDQFAKAVSPGGAPAAGEYLALSMLPTLAASAYRFDTPGARINYGIDQARFPSPLVAGSRIRSHVDLVEVRRIPAGLQLTVATTVEIEGADRSACEAVTLTLLKP